MLTRLKRAVAKQFGRRPQRPHFDAAAYWEKRHRAHGTALTGVGHIELSAAQNAADYDVKLSRVVAALERAVGSLADKKTLDAGCGIGLLTERLEQHGGAVTAVDVSATAIATARQRTSAAVTYHCIPLDAMTWEAQFDCVVCMDVLFHVVDDAQWQRALARLVAAAKPGAPILIQEMLGKAGQNNAIHVRWRSLDMYRDGLALCGAAIERQETYRLPSEEAEKDILTIRCAPA